MSEGFQESHAPSAARFRFSGTLIIGIDLGSIFSGISYERFNPQDPTGSRCWVHTANLCDMSGPRVPTKIAASHYSQDEQFRNCLLEWFKISLFRDDDLPQDVGGSSKFIKLTANRKALSVSAMTATADYLKLLWSDFKRSIGNPIFDFEYNPVITVPTFRSPHECQMVLDVIHQADILSSKVRLAPKFIADIEAASISLLKDLSKPRYNVPPSLKNGNVAIVCDCGGFTVESTAYEILALESFSLREIIPGECILAGGDLIDDAFMNLFKAKVVECYPASILETISDQHFHDFAQACWERDMKLNYSGDRKEWTVHLPWTSQYDKKTISFNGFELSLVFDPIVDKIVNLVISQIDNVTEVTDEGPEHILVAGGFGRSPYVQTRVKQAVHKLSPSTVVRCFSGDEGCTAVSRGAVLHGLQTLRSSSSPGYKGPPYVTSRMTRASYGVVWDSKDQPDSGIAWLARKGETLSAVHPKRTSLPRQAISATTTDSVAYSMARICYKLESDLQENPMCTISWPVARTESRFALEFNWDGVQMGFSVLHRGARVRGMEVEYSPYAREFCSVAQT